MATEGTPKPTRARIAILGSRGIPARYGGFETFAEQLSVRLVAAGYRVTVFCEGERGAGADEYRGIQLEYVPVPSCGPLTPILADVRSLLRARGSFDVVYMLGYGASFACWIPRLSGARVWINMDGLEWKRAKWNLAGRTWLRWMSRIAETTATRLIFDAAAVRVAELGERAAKRTTSVIEYGAELASETPAAQRIVEYNVEPQRYHLVVCRLEPENHVLEIVRGHTASGARYPLAIVGGLARDTAYVRACRAAAGPHTLWLDGVYDQAKLQALRHYCISYVHGHSVGGTNPSLLEAMASGNLTLAHDNPFNREVLRDAALYFSDSTELATCLERAESMPATERAELRSDCIARIETYYNWERIAEEYARLLESGG